MQNIYRVLDRNNCHIDISLSEKATKRYATMNDYDCITIRYNCSYTVKIVARKIKNKWVTNV